MRSSLIGIAGLSGSGKTTLASELAARVGLQAEIISLDSYYKAQSNLTIDERAGVNYDHPDALDWLLLERNLVALAGGEAIEEPRYLYDQHTRSSETRRVEPRPFVILEGILTLHREKIRELLDLKIFVDTSPEECLRRRLERDITERGRTRDSVIEQYRRTVWPMALEFVLPSRAFAGLTVSGEKPMGDAVDAVLAQLIPHAAGAVC